MWNHIYRPSSAVCRHIAEDSGRLVFKERVDLIHPIRVHARSVQLGTVTWFRPTAWTEKNHRQIQIDFARVKVVRGFASVPLCGYCVLYLGALV